MPRSTHRVGAMAHDLLVLASGVMDVISDVIPASAMANRRPTMTTTKTATTTRRCVGSKRFGIEPREAPIHDFPKQPSQKDGLGRMCREHWKAYTAGLKRDAAARRAREAQDRA